MRPKTAGRVDTVVLPVVLVSLMLILLWMSQEVSVPRAPLLATVRDSNRSAASASRLVQNLSIHAATRISRPQGPGSSREARGRGRDPLLHHRAIVGRDARTPWYIRVRSLMLLLLIVIGLGMAIAGVTLLIIASGRFLLEILAG